MPTEIAADRRADRIQIIFQSLHDSRVLINERRTNSCVPLSVEPARARPPRQTQPNPSETIQAPALFVIGLTLSWGAAERPHGTAAFPRVIGLPCSRWQWQVRH